MSSSSGDFHDLESPGKLDYGMKKTRLDINMHMMQGAKRIYDMCTVFFMS